MVLLLLYFAVLMGLMAAAAQIFRINDAGLFQPRSIIFLIVVSLTTASVHFCFSTLGAVGFLRNNLAAVKPDPQDGIHKRLINVLQDIRVVTGSKRTIDGAVIPTLAMNALAAVGLRGNAVIAITEGLLSRLTRPQLEAVIAH